MAAVLLVGLLFLFYYFSIISRQETVADSRAFRSLAAVSTQFQDLAGNYGEVMHRAVSTLPTQQTAPPEIAGSPVADTSQVARFLTSQIRALTPLICSDSQMSIVEVATREGVNYLRFHYGKHCGDIGFGDLLEPLINGTPNLLFDEILLTDTRGQVLYQTHRSGVIVTDLSSAVATLTDRTAAKKPEKSSDKQADADSAEESSGGAPAYSGASAASRLVTINLAGTEYRGYLVPVPVTVSAKPGTLHLALCGLIRQTEFQKIAHSVPGAALAMVILSVLLAIVAAWPLLKFGTMQRTERIPHRAAVYYALSSTGTIILVIVLLIHVRYVFSDPETRQNLEDLAAGIDRNFGIEVDSALKLMDAVVHSPEFVRTPYRENAEVPCSTEQHFQPGNDSIEVLTRPSLPLADFPYFRRLYAYDGQGFEQLSWTIDSESPPLLRVCDRTYFQAALQNHLWNLRSSGLEGPRFRVDPVYSRLSGEYLAVISQLVPQEFRGTPPVLRVMILTTRLMSLIGPVLPPDYGLAVIDQSGKVLFHSDTAKNGRENFFDECEDSSGLRAAIEGNRESHLNLRYLGNDYEGFVRPFGSVQQSGWYLITFSDLSAVAAQRVERMVLFCALILIYFAFMAAVISLVMLLEPEGRKWFWPSETRTGCYYHLAISMAIVTMLFLWIVFTTSPTELLLLAYLLPISAIVIIVAKLVGRSGKLIRSIAAAGAAVAAVTLIWRLFWEQTGAWHAFIPILLICATYYALGSEWLTERLHNPQKSLLPTSFSMACFALLVLISVPVCIAFFKTAFDFEEEAATRREQLLTVKALAGSEKRVVEEYSKVKISPGGQQTLAEDLGKWLFLRRRLEDVTLDVYDDVFSDQHEPGIFLPGRTISWQEALHPVNPHAEVAPGAYHQPWLLRSLFAKLPFHRAGSLTYALNQGSSDDSDWIWENEGANLIRMHHKSSSELVEEAEGSPQTAALAKLAANDPVFLSHDLAYSLGLLKAGDFFSPMVFPLVLVLILMYFSLRSTLSKMFLLNIELPQPFPSVTVEEALGRNDDLILLTRPLSNVGAALAEHEDKIHVLDLGRAKMGEGPPSVETDRRIIVLDHFERCLDDKQLNRWTLQVLYNLKQLNKKVILITTIDPKYYFGRANQGAAWSRGKWMHSPDRERWEEMLARFTQVQLAGESLEEFPHLLWSTCTWDEQVALFGIAKDGWANYKNRSALEQLARRGLIAASPDFRLTSDAFRDFIRADVSKDEQRRWHMREAAGLWDGLRVMIYVVIVGVVAAVLFFNQLEVLGYITTAITAILPITRLVSEARSGRAAKAGSNGSAEA